ncbi:hypothetical protein GCM10029978_034970 [Actinoallomurus acanthiterrae]
MATRSDERPIAVVRRPMIPGDRRTHIGDTMQVDWIKLYKA